MLFRSSEAVYGPILRHENALESESITWGFYVDKMVSLRPLIIYCRPPQEKIFSFSERDQMDGVIQAKHSLLLAYDRLIGKLVDRVQIVNYDFTSLVEPTYIDLVVEAYLINRR